MKRILPIAIVFLLGCLCSNAQTPLQIDPQVAAQHLLDNPEPEYPPVALADRIQGTVAMLIDIDRNGLVSSVGVLDGPAMFRISAMGTVWHYAYTPFKEDGEPVNARTIVALSYWWNGRSWEEHEEKSVDQFFQVFLRCGQMVDGSTAPEDQVEACRNAVQRSEAFKEKTHLSERRIAYSEYTLALIHAGKAADAVTAGKRAVSFARAEEYDPYLTAGGAAAYEINGKALALAGDLSGADKSLTKAESFQRDVIPLFRQNSPMRGHYKQVLKSMLEYHAKILTKMGKQEEAQKKLKEAAKI